MPSRRAAEYKKEEINTIVEKSLDVLNVQLKNANILTAFERGEDLPLVKIDRHQIQQVLINIMLNAIHAMEKGGALTVRTFLADSGGVGIEVKDTGVGIPAAHLKRIFDPFFTTKSRGTGLGLSITHEITGKSRSADRCGQRRGEGIGLHHPLPGRRRMNRNPHRQEQAVEKEGFAGHKPVPRR